ncbi:hypothetical protein H0H93_016640, partial [Arthromyces matolae]
GGHIMLGGIVFQLVTNPRTTSAVIVVYTILAAEFFVRYFHNKPFRKSDSSTESLHFHKPMSELADGWKGRIIRTEIYFGTTLTLLFAHILTSSMVP